MYYSFYFTADAGNNSRTFGSVTVSVVKDEIGKQQVNLLLLAS